MTTSDTKVEEQLTYFQSRAVKITEDRMCPQCNKRIGNRYDWVMQ